MFAKHPHIVVVGAGIVGASLAYHLVRNKARVTLVDKTIQSDTRATDQSFAWITVTADAPEDYIALRQQAMVDWHRVEAELKGALQVDWSGALTWHEDLLQTERSLAKLAKSGYEVRLLEPPQIRLLEPNLRQVPAGAMLAPNEGAIDARLTTHRLINAARQAGVDTQLDHEVWSLMTNGSRVTGVVTARGKINADRVVLATGANTNHLCQPLGVTLPVQESPAILMAFHTPQPVVKRIISTPWMDIRAASAKLTLAAADYVDESIANNPPAIAQRSLAKLQQDWQGAEHFSVANVTVGQRPMPPDGLPIIGRLAAIEDLYVSVMHAGVTLAAVVGRLATKEILSEEDTVVLSAYRPTRFK